MVACCDLRLVYHCVLSVVDHYVLSLVDHFTFAGGPSLTASIAAHSVGHSMGSNRKTLTQEVKGRGGKALTSSVEAGSQVSKRV